MSDLDTAVVADTGNDGDSGSSEISDSEWAVLTKDLKKNETKKEKADTSWMDEYAKDGEKEEGPETSWMDSYEGEAESDEGDGDSEAEAAPKTWKLKAYDKEVTVDEKKLVELAQQQIAGGTKLEQLKQKEAEVAKLRGQADTMKGQYHQFWQLMATNDVGTINEVWEASRQKVPGLKPFRDIVMDYVGHELQWAQMSPEQQEAADAKAQLTRLQREREHQEKQREQQRAAYEDKVAADWISTEFPKAISAVGMKQSAEVVKRIADIAFNAVRQGINPNLVDIAKHVKKQMEDEVASHLNTWDDDILDKLPPELIKKIDQARVKQKRQSNVPIRNSSGNSKPRNKPYYGSLDSDW